MKHIGWLFVFSLSCAEPPSSVNPGVAQPGAPEPGAPGAQADAGAAPADAADGGTPAAAAGGNLDEPPGAIVASPGPDAPKERPQPVHPQETLTQTGVTISGTLVCEDCTGGLLVRIEDASARPPILLTKKSFTGVGPYSILAPRDMSVILMVVHDKNSDGYPTPGEELGLWTGGLVETTDNATEIDLTVGLMPDQPPVNLDPAPAE